ncbi:DUF5684 domain-containing protein [Agromyces larvae]|uniref:DUF5684 domain-containing protein n=1 Tax=Agromyces larvae TaxID=2929802 RepID=A0ABY4C1C5_9MICO|nr:DUF5684 domain-containing protein [Agromyces larvae]UOE43936.1 DUF5684 domain-containing protein [Agromyces larvae]
MTHIAAVDAFAVSMGIFVFVWAFVGFVLVATYVATGVLLSKVFRATGQPGWPAWVPVYGTWKLLETGGQRGWLALLSFVPVANVVSAVFLIIAVHKINEGFGKGVGHTVLYVSLPFVWMVLIGFGGAPWRGLQPAGAAAFPGHPGQAYPQPASPQPFGYQAQPAALPQAPTVPQAQPAYQPTTPQAQPAYQPQQPAYPPYAQPQHHAAAPQPPAYPPYAQAQAPQPQPQPGYPPYAQPQAQPQPAPQPPQPAAQPEQLAPQPPQPAAQPEQLAAQPQQPGYQPQPPQPGAGTPASYPTPPTPTPPA